LILLLYVDDIILTYGSFNMCNSFIFHLSKTFSMKDFGDVNYFLGIQVVCNTLRIFRWQYFMPMICFTSFTYLLANPFYRNNQFVLLYGELLPNSTEYTSIVGALQYHTMTRPDIAYRFPFYTPVLLTSIL